MRSTVAFVLLAPQLIDAAVPAVPAIQCKAVSSVVNSLKACKTATSFCSSLLGIKTSTVTVQAAAATVTSGSSTVTDTTITSSVTFTASAQTQVTRTDTVSIGPDCSAKSTVTGTISGSNVVPRAEHEERDAHPQVKNPLLAIARNALSTACSCLSLTTPTLKQTKTSTITVQAPITATTTQTVTTVTSTSTATSTTETTLPAPAQCTASLGSGTTLNNRRFDRYLCVIGPDDNFQMVNLDNNPGTCLWRPDSNDPDLDILGGNRATFLRWTVTNGRITENKSGKQAYVEDHVDGGKLMLDLPGTTPTRTTGNTKTPVQCAIEAGFSQPVKPVCYNSNGAKWTWYSIGDDSTADDLYLGLTVPSEGHERQVQFRPSCALSNVGYCQSSNPDPENPAPSS